MSNSNLDDKWVVILSAVAGNASGWQIIPSWIEGLTCTAIPGGGGTARFEHCTDTPENIIASPGSVQAIPWDLSNVSTPQSAATRGPVTAVRLVATTQNATGQICGQRKRL